MPYDPKILEAAAAEREAAIGKLGAAIDAGMIRNADLEGIKFSVSRAFYDERRLLPDVLGRPQGKRDWLEDLWYEIVQLPPYSVQHVNVIAKRLPRLLKRADEPTPRLDQAAAAVLALADRWKPVAELLDRVKPMIVKGRAPSETPADPRDLKNTGTCSCCARNVKLKDLKIVDHGFQVYSGRVGHCFGVGYYPIEISSEGVTALRLRMAGEAAGKQDYMQRLLDDKVDTFWRGPPMALVKLTRDDPKFERTRQGEIEQTRSEIRSLLARINQASKVEAEWQPRILPDGATHFALGPIEEEPASPAP